MSTIRKADSGYIPTLDGFRGGAILLVIISHYGFGHILPGGFGVTLFFFVSGFLITRLMVAEFERTNRLDLPKFYARRMLRLYPALLFFIVVSVVFNKIEGCQIAVNDALSSLFYYRNYYMIYATADVPAMCAKVYNIVWSLAVEEHFYIGFPLLFLALYRRPKVFIGFLLLTIVGALVWRSYLVATQGTGLAVVDRIYRLTDTRFDAIMFGCLVSLLLHRDKTGAYLRFAGHGATVIASLALLLFTFIYRDIAFRETVRYSMQGMALSLLLPTIVYHKQYSNVADWFSSPWLVTVGKLSYSLYMFHWVGVCAAERYVSPYRATPSWIIVAASVGLLLSLISYYYIEKPMMRIRKRFGSNVQLIEPSPVRPVPTNELV